VVVEVAVLNFPIHFHRSDSFPRVARFVQDSVQDFLQDSFPPPPLFTPTMAYHDVQGGGDIVANTCTDAASSGSN
jgi:hypothetical protein